MPAAEDFLFDGPAKATRTIGFGFMIVLAVVITPVQTAVIAIPTIIVGVLNRARQAHLQQTS